VDDLIVYNHQPEREATCPACRAQRDGRGSDNRNHTCRTPPAVPRNQVEGQARADDQVIADRETQIRQTRLAEIRRGWAD
jgi:hypothetical protein